MDKLIAASLSSLKADPAGVITVEYRFGTVLLLRHRREVLIESQRVPIGGRAFDLLLLLIEQRHRVLAKDELLNAIWPDQAVEDGNLHVQISALRRLLGAATIATVRGRGYQFTAALSPLTSNGQTGVPALPQGREAALFGPVASLEQAKAEHIFADLTADLTLFAGRLLRAAKGLRLAVEICKSLRPPQQPTPEKLDSCKPETASTTAASTAAAVACLVASAAAAGAGFTLTPEALIDLATLCRDLDRLSLAIEIAVGPSQFGLAAGNETSSQAGEPAL